MKRPALVIAFALLPLTAGAQVIAECDWIGTAANIVEPWSDHSRTFANGAIRVALVDTGGEPACCSAHLMILSPSGDGTLDPVYRQCHVASGDEGLGFYNVDVAGITARYDPGTGLLLSVPVEHWHEAVDQGGTGSWERMEIRVNQSSGTVTVE